MNEFSILCYLLSIRIEQSVWFGFEHKFVLDFWRKRLICEFVLEC